MQDTAKVLMVQSCDFITDTSGDGSRARIRAACDLVKAGKIPHNCTVLWPQGYQKNDPGRPERLGQESLGENMARYAREQPELSRASVIFEPSSWGTKGDVRACYRMVREAGYRNAEFFFVSDPVHLRRVKLVWWMTHPKGWRASFFPAESHRMGRFDRLIREPIALVSYFFTMLPDFLFKREPGMRRV